MRRNPWLGARGIVENERRKVRTLGYKDGVDSPLEDSQDMATYEWSGEQISPGQIAFCPSIICHPKRAADHLSGECANALLD